MFKIFALFLVLLSTSVHASYLDNKISELVELKQEKIEILEKCQKDKGGLMAAGITTLGVSAIGIGVNIGEAIALKRKGDQINELVSNISDLNIEINAEQKKIDNTCGDVSSCVGTPNLEEMHAKKAVCINGEWKVTACADFYSLNYVNTCTRNGKTVTYYDECSLTGKAGKDGVVMIQRVDSSGRVMQVEQGNDVCGVEKLSIEQGNTTTVIFGETQKIKILEYPTDTVAVATASDNVLTLTAVGGVNDNAKIKLDIEGVGECEYGVQIMPALTIQMQILYNKQNTVALSETINISSQCQQQTLEVTKGDTAIMKVNGYKIIAESDDPGVIKVEQSGEGVKLIGVGNVDESTSITFTFQKDGKDEFSCTYTAKVIPAKELEVTYKQYENVKLVLGEAEQQITLSCNNGEIEVPQGGKSTLKFPYNVTVTSEPSDKISATASEKTLVVAATGDAPVDSTLNVVLNIGGVDTCTYTAKVVPAKEIEVIQSTDEVLVTVITENKSQIQIILDSTQEFDSNTVSANCDGVVTVTGAELKDLEILYADLTDGQTANYTTTPIQVTKENSPKTIGIIIKYNGEQKYTGSFSCSIGQETVIPGTTTISFSNENTAGPALECGGEVTLQQNQSQTWNISGATASNISVSKKEYASATIASDGKSITVIGGEQPEKIQVTFTLTDANNQQTACQFSVSVVSAASEFLNSSTGNIESTSSEATCTPTEEEQNNCAANNAVCGCKLVDGQKNIYITDCLTNYMPKYDTYGGIKSCDCECACHINIQQEREKYYSENHIVSAYCEDNNIKITLCDAGYVPSDDKSACNVKYTYVREVCPHLYGLYDHSRNDRLGLDGLWYDAQDVSTFRGKLAACGYDISSVANQTYLGLYSLDGSMPESCAMSPNILEYIKNDSALSAAYEQCNSKKRKKEIELCQSNVKRDAKNQFNNTRVRYKMYKNELDGTYRWENKTGEVVMNSTQSNDCPKFSDYEARNG